MSEMRQAAQQQSQQVVEVVAAQGAAEVTAAAEAGDNAMAQGAAEVAAAQGAAAAGDEKSAAAGDEKSAAAAGDEQSVVAQEAGDEQSAEAQAAGEKASWYPVRVFFGRAEAIKEAAEDAGVEFFYPMRLVEKFTSGGLKYIEEPLVRSLIFLKATRQELRDLKARNNSSLVPYYDRLTHAPLVVPEKQMERFISLCKLKDSGLEYLGEDGPAYHQGDKVRVTDGIFKGFVGHIKRIRHDRKLIVTIEGVAAFATRFIPPSMLEKVE